jgi:hypothetical protein
MSFVASFENCRELLELCGWNRAPTYYRVYDGEPRIVELLIGRPRKEVYTAAYELGHLMRMLPTGSIVWSKSEDTWAAMYGEEVQEADTPEDAACKLAIALWKQRKSDQVP